MKLTKIGDIGYIIMFGHKDIEYVIGTKYKIDLPIIPLPYIHGVDYDPCPPYNKLYKVKIVDDNGTVEILKQIYSTEDEILQIIKSMQTNKQYSQFIFDCLTNIIEIDGIKREYIMCTTNKGHNHNIIINKNGTSTIDNPNINRQCCGFYSMDHPYIASVYNRKTDLWNCINTRTNKLLLHKWVDEIGDYGYRLDTLASFKVVKNVIVTVRKIAKDVYAYNMLNHEGNLVFGHDLIIYTKRYALTYDYLVKSKRNKYNFAHLNDFLLLDKFMDFSSLKEINTNDLKKL